MGFIKKYKWEIIVFVFLLAVYSLTRLLTLTQIPIFTDEAIYVRWAQIAENDANWRFISLTDGKQPLFIWIAMILMKFVSDPLVAGRLVSVLAGFASIVGLFMVGKEVFKNRWVGIVSSTLYALSPFALIYDRMALYDSLVGTFAIWGLYFTVLLVRTMRLDVALMMGFVTGAAVLNKTNGFFTIYLLPFAALLFDWSRKNLRNRLIRFAGLSLLVVVMTYGIYMLLRLSPFFYIIDEKNAVFVYPLSEWIKHPFLQLWPNTTALYDWYIRYIGLPLTLFALGSFFVNKKFLREKGLLFLWFVLPLIALAVMGKQIYPRYIFFMTLSLLPLAAYTFVSLLSRTKKKLVMAVLFIALVSYSLYTSAYVLFNVAKAPIPRSDIGQYILDWPSGVGINESVAFFKEKAENEKIFIATEGTFGLLPFAYEIYLVNNPNVTIKAYWPMTTEIPQELLETAKTQKVYTVFYQGCHICQAKGLSPLGWPVKPVLQIKRVEPNSYLTVYEVVSQ